MTNTVKKTSNFIKTLADLLKVEYDCNKGTGAQTSDMINIFKKQFNYANGGKYEILTEEDAEPLVREDIQNGLPVIMDGYNDKKKKGKLWWKKTVYDKGHCWVCDGYKQVLYKTVKDKNESTAEYSVQRFYHMNWGWGGSDNGWFDFSDIQTTSRNYQYHRGYLTGIKAQ